MSTDNPALFRHCVTVYDLMREHAQTDKLYPGKEEEGLVYEGFLTRLFRENGLSVPYYTLVMRALRRMGCVEQLRRGGSSTPSRWHLIEAPTIEAFLSTENRTVTRAQRKSRMDKLEQQVNDLNRRLTSAEEILDALLQEHLEKLDAEERLAETSAPIETP